MKHFLTSPILYPFILGMKPTKNPWVIEKTKSSFDRQCPLSSIPYVVRSDGTKGCIWCGDDLKTKHPAIV